MDMILGPKNFEDKISNITCLLFTLVNPIPVFEGDKEKERKEYTANIIKEKIAALIEEALYGESKK